MNNRNYKTEYFSSALLGEGYEKIYHPSGLTVYVYPKKMATKYAIFGTKYGSIDSVFRPSGSKELVKVPDGIAHFLEHKLFSNEDGSDSFEKFSAMGADANAYTSFDKTAYLFSCTHNFKECLEELVSFVRHPYFTDETVKKEVGIIAEEIKMYEDTPADKCFFSMLEGMYKSKSISTNICGSEESIKDITPELLYSCYNAFYRLDNMILAVCGDVDSQTVLDVIDPLLPSVCEGAPTECENPNDSEPREAIKSLVTRDMQVSKPIFELGFKDTDILSDGRRMAKKAIIMNMLGEILFSKSGELYSELFESHRISTSLSNSFSSTKGFAFFSASSEADDPQSVCDTILEYIDNAKVSGVCESDFNRVKRVLYSEWIKSFDSVDEIANSIFSCVCDGTELFDYVDILEGITLEDVNETLRSSFDRSTMTLSAVYPLDEND